MDPVLEIRFSFVRLGICALLGLYFVTFGILFEIADTVDFPGRLLTAFFSLWVLAAIWKLFDRKPVLTATEEGVLVPRWSNEIIPWANISDIYITAFDVLRIILRDEEVADESLLNCIKLWFRRNVFVNGKIQINLVLRDANQRELLGTVYDYLDAYSPE
ncbi:MAG: hypothetical protein EXR11_01785 [Rhodospirillaceae bacterium]|nr:hypothetical protein [Rhodospirillaceae bacterium]